MDEIAILENTMRGRKPAERRQAIVRLGEMAAKQDKALNQLFFGLEDKDCEVRHLAAAALRQFGPEIVKENRTLIPVLVGQLRKGETERRLLVIRSIRAIGKPAIEAAPALIQEMTDPDAEIRRLSILALLAIGTTLTELLQSELIQRTRDEDTDVRWTACFALDALKAKGANVAAALKKASTDENPDIQKLARRALKRFRTKAKAVAA